VLVLLLSLGVVFMIFANSVMEILIQRNDESSYFSLMA